VKKYLAVLIVGLVSGLSLGWLLYHPRAAKMETPAPEIRQSDGSLVLERKPDAAAKAPAEIPRGAKLERVVKVEIQPKPTIALGGSSAPGGADAVPVCPVAELDLALLRNQDNSERVVASTPNGEIISGVDIPVTPMPQVARVPRWTVSALRGYDLMRSKAAWGAGLSYARGPFVLTGGAVGSTVFIGAGIRF
jgi:hypothetical protein